MMILTALADDLLLRTLALAHPYKALVRLSMTCGAERARWAALVARWRNTVVFMELLSARMLAQVAARVHRKVRVHRVYADGEYCVQTVSNRTKYASVLLFDPHGVVATLYYKPRTFAINYDARSALAATCEVRYDVQDRTVRVHVTGRRRPAAFFRFDAAADAVATLAGVLRAHRLFY